MNKLKPCMNNMCFKYKEKIIGNCHAYVNNEIGFDGKVTSCKKYLTEKPESIHKKMWEKLEHRISNCDIGWYYMKKDLLKIMQKIEKELT